MPARSAAGLATVNHALLAAERGVAEDKSELSPFSALAAVALVWVVARGSGEAGRLTGGGLADEEVVRRSEAPPVVCHAKTAATFGSGWYRHRRHSPHTRQACI